MSLCVFIFCLCVGWRGFSSLFSDSWLYSSCTPVCKWIITSTCLLACLSSVFQLAVYLHLFFTHSLSECCFNHNGSYNSRQTFISLMIQVLHVLHANLFLLCPRNVTCHQPLIQILPYNKNSCLTTHPSPCPAVGPLLCVHNRTIWLTWTQQTWTIYIIPKIS